VQKNTARLAGRLMNEQPRNTRGYEVSVGERGSVPNFSGLKMGTDPATAADPNRGIGEEVASEPAA
jgi:hypothetical protein